MKPFRNQYIECKKNEMVGEGEFKSFKDNPGLLPFCPCKLEKILSSNIEGIQLQSCLMFRGLCSSGNPDCVKMREKE
jgi:hypothetical protein